MRLYYLLAIILISVPGTPSPGPYFLRPIRPQPPGLSFQPQTPGLSFEPQTTNIRIEPQTNGISFESQTTGIRPDHAESSAIGSLLSKAQYEQLFPHHHSIYTYEALITASTAFPFFAAEGNSESRKRELAAFFAHIAHETTSGWPGAKGGPYVWGLVYTEEQACLDGHCTQYNTGGTSTYKPIPGKSYYGRGPLQLTYAYNYGLAGDELGLPLLAKPELVSHDGVIAFKTALWFWMRAQKPKPSCHEVMCGKWQPTPDDLRLGRKPGFGMTINIINGGVECNSNTPAVKDLRLERIGFYLQFAALLKVTAGQDCDCSGMGTYGN
jgi:basic endochitinase B